MKRKNYCSEEEKIIEDIKAAIILWIISWLGTISIILTLHFRNLGYDTFPSVLIVCDILFPLMFIKFKKRLKEFRKND